MFKTFIKKLSAITILFLVPATSHAIIEGRLTYGLLSSKDAISDVCGNSVCTGTLPSMVPLYGLGGDVIVKLPLIPFGFGMRYESLGLTASAGTVDIDAKLKRTALLVNYRFIDTIVHFGIIGSYGLSHDGTFTAKQSGSKVADYSGTSMTTYSMGVELEVKPLIVLPLIVGAEVGYMGAKWNGAQDGVVTTRTKDIDLSGSYAKAFIGLDF